MAPRTVAGLLATLTDDVDPHGLRAAFETLTAPSTEPLYFPDQADPHVLRDAGTGELHPEIDPQSPGPDLVRWWPQLPPSALAVGYTELTDVPSDELLITGVYDPAGHDPQRDPEVRTDRGPAADLLAYAATVAKFRSRDTGWHLFARGMRGGGHHAEPRHQARAIARSYRDWLTFLEPFGDPLAAAYAAEFSETLSAQRALTETERGTMPTATQSATVSSLATRIRDQITAGHGGRLVVSDSEVAFAWAPGQAATLLSYLSKHTVDGRHTTVVSVKDGAVKAGPVAEGAAKPSPVVVFESDDVDLVKYAGMAVMPVESAQFISNIEPALAAVMTGQILRAVEADAVTEITAAAGVVITAAADITAGVLAAVAGIRGNGGTPTVVGLNSDDWVALAGATLAAGGEVDFSSWLGMVPILVPGLAAGSAIVLDGTSVSVLEPAGGPLCVVDMYTELTNNRIRIVIEEWATSKVTSPGGVATVATTTP